MKDLIIVGAGGFGREVLQLIKEINKSKETWKIKGFIDDRSDALDSYACDYNVIGSIADWNPIGNEVFVCAIAAPKIKEKTVKNLKSRGAQFVSVMHPSVLVSDFAAVGEGVVAYPNTIISANSAVGDFATLLSCGIGHDAIVGDYSTISTYCDVTGGAVLGKRVFLGSRVSVTPNRKIGDDAYICAGSVVMTNIKANMKAMGYPAKKFDL